MINLRSFDRRSFCVTDLTKWNKSFIFVFLLDLSNMQKSFYSICVQHITNFQQRVGLFCQKASFPIHVYQSQKEPIVIFHNRQNWPIIGCNLMQRRNKELESLFSLREQMFPGSFLLDSSSFFFLHLTITSGFYFYVSCLFVWTLSVYVKSRVTFLPG